jgi:drug/metabolite transporter (DMT)-like permease
MITALSLLWGSEWLANMQLSDLPHLRVIAVRCLIAAMVLLPFALPKRPDQPKLDYGRNALLGIGLIAAPVLLSSLATNISSGLAVVLFAAMPLIATLFESSGLTGAPYLLGGLLGVCFLVRSSLSFSSTQGFSILWSTLAVFSVAASMVKGREWLQGQNLPRAILVQMLSAAATIGTYSLIREDSTGPWSISQISTVVTLAISGSAVAYMLFYSLLRGFRASQIAILQWLTPVVGVGEAAIWLRHFPSWEKAASAVAIVVCAVLLLRMKPDDPTEAPQGISPLTFKITLL